jgi:hypothetical protein
VRADNYIVVRPLFSSFECTSVDGSLVGFLTLSSRVVWWGEVVGREVRRSRSVSADYGRRSQNDAFSLELSA